MNLGTEPRTFCVRGDCTTPWYAHSTSIRVVSEAHSTSCGKHCSVCSVYISGNNGTIHAHDVVWSQFQVPAG